MHDRIAMCFPKKKHYTLAGFKPGSSVSTADAMTIAPRRRVNWPEFCHCGKHYRKIILPLYNHLLRVGHGQGGQMSW
jgi:hypothetical protein